MHRGISTRAELIDALRVAAELEHQLMAQYLFAAYSFKRYTWEGLESPANVALIANRLERREVCRSC